MPRNVEPLSAAQIHSVYASGSDPKNKAVDAEAIRYSKTSAYVRDPVLSGRSPLHSNFSSNKKKY
ncbi:hypothetical protein [Dyella acidiphila]|uniref:Uncharacterized protein n=1 Tax=Dyella acidiphila TaxID=2775866 RepID=A0ABR9G6H1_9GAMM|nr:hypothetical protein [Dyella acidiphila]MBE1159646.1 hypothetical protein [Dyella acidiphila]